MKIGFGKRFFVLITAGALLATWGMVTSTGEPLKLSQSTPEIRVVNPATNDTDFLFTSATPIGTLFNATVWIFNYTDLYAWQCRLYFNSTLLSATRAWNAVFDLRYVFSGRPYINPTPVIGADNVLAGDSLFWPPGVSGSGIALVIEFQIIYTPPDGIVSCALNISNADTFLLDSNGMNISHSRSNGYYEYSALPIIHNVEWTPTCPPPYVASTTVRANEPVLVKANVTGPVSTVTLHYRANESEWWNTTMQFNATQQLWITTVPGQLGNTTVEFRVRAESGGGETESSLYEFDVKALLVGDINADLYVGIDDIFAAASHFGEENP